MPYTALPVTLSGVSRRLTPLPMIFQSFGSLSLISDGGSILDAATATLPKVVLRPDGVITHTPSGRKTKSAHTRLRATFWPAVGNSYLTFDHSHSSSSATIWQRPVSVPWPISERATRIEMGQGTLTGLCQMVAEELECE